jgi:hypothetical protein
VYYLLDFSTVLITAIEFFSFYLFIDLFFKNILLEDHDFTRGTLTGEYMG